MQDSPSFITTALRRARRFASPIHLSCFGGSQGIVLEPVSPACEHLGAGPGSVVVTVLLLTCKAHVASQGRSRCIVRAKTGIKPRVGKLLQSLRPQRNPPMNNLTEKTSSERGVYTFTHEEVDTVSFWQAQCSSVSVSSGSEQTRCRCSQLLCSLSPLLIFITPAHP